MLSISATVGWAAAAEPPHPKSQPAISHAPVRVFAILVSFRLHLSLNRPHVSSAGARPPVQRKDTRLAGFAAGKTTGRFSSPRAPLPRGARGDDVRPPAQRPVGHGPWGYFP